MGKLKAKAKKVSLSSADKPKKQEPKYSAPSSSRTLLALLSPQLTHLVKGRMDFNVFAGS